MFLTSRIRYAQTNFVLIVRFKINVREVVSSRLICERRTNREMMHKILSTIGFLSEFSWDPPAEIILSDRSFAPMIRKFNFEHFNFNDALKKLSRQYFLPSAVVQ